MAETHPTYRIRVQGCIDDRWTDWLGGLALHRRDDGTTVLIGPVPDQAALHGVFALIRDLGLPLLSVNRMHRLAWTNGGRPRDGRRADDLPGGEAIGR